MQAVDFFRSRIDVMINMNDPLAALATRLPWSQIEAAVAQKFEHQDRTGEVLRAQDMFGTTEVLVGAGRSNAGRSKLPSRLLEIARHKIVSAAKRAGIEFKQTFAKEGKALRWKAGGCAHAKQFRRLKRVLRRQRTILGIVMREVQRKLLLNPTDNALALTSLNTCMERAERVRTQQRSDKNKLYALHEPEVECIGKGKARKPYEFGVKSAVVVSHKDGLMLGARTFPGNPYDGHILSAVLEQATILTQDVRMKIKHIVVDFGFRGVDAANPDKEIIHRGKFKSLSNHQKGWLKRGTAVEPAIGHLKSDQRMDRCWLQGALGDALHTIARASGYNLRWLLRAIARLGIGALFLRLLQTALLRQRAIGRSYLTIGCSWFAGAHNWIGGIAVKNRIFGHAAQGAF